MNGLNTTKTYVSRSARRCHFVDSMSGDEERDFLFIYVTFEKLAVGSTSLQYRHDSSKIFIFYKLLRTLGVVMLA